MAEISHDLSKFFVIFDNSNSGHEREVNCDISVERIGSNINVPIGAFVISKGEAG